MTHMSKLKIGVIADDKPVAINIKLPAAVWEARVIRAVLIRAAGHPLLTIAFATSYACFGELMEGLSGR